MPNKRANICCLESHHGRHWLFPLCRLLEKHQMLRRGLTVAWLHGQGDAINLDIRSKWAAFCSQTNKLFIFRLGTAIQSSQPSPSVWSLWLNFLPPWEYIWRTLPPLYLQTVFWAPYFRLRTTCLFPYGFFFYIHISELVLSPHYYCKYHKSVSEFFSPNQHSAPFSGQTWDTAPVNTSCTIVTQTSTRLIGNKGVNLFLGMNHSPPPQSVW